MTASILSYGRLSGAFGMAGSSPALPGCDGILRADTGAEELGSCATVQVANGNVFVIETPGGGGFG